MPSLGSALCRTLLIPALLLLVACTASAAAVFVDQNAPGPDHDGTSWDTAFLTIQEGVNAATPSGEVWVANGTYVENVVMGSGVQLYGGFLGAEPGGYEDSLDQRDFVGNVTAIDGNRAGSCVRMASGCSVDGFTITNGSAIEEGGEAHGGGIYCVGLEEPGAIVNDVITKNKAIYGGGIYCVGDSLHMIADNTITSNAVLSCAGGIYLEGASPEITDNAISNNSVSAGDGGGIFCLDSSPIIVGNSIAKNSAHSGGMGAGICCRHRSSPHIEGNGVTDNSSSGGGGGICCTDQSSPTVVNNTITGNSGYYGGGGIRCEGSAPVMTGNGIAGNIGHGVLCLHSFPVISGNSVEDNEGNGISFEDTCGFVTDNIIAGNTGEGISCWHSAPRVMDNTISNNSKGGIDLSEWSSPAVTGNVITSNIGEYYGGGFSCYDSFPIVTGNSIVCNTVSERGGGLFCWGGSPVVANNTVMGNWAGHYGGGIHCFSASAIFTGNTLMANSAGRGGAGIYCRECSPVVANNTIVGNSAVLYGGGICCWAEHDEVCSPLVANNIVAHNTAEEDGGGIYATYDARPSLVCNDFWGNEPDDYYDCGPGVGDISEDPLFVSPAAGDLHLKRRSPCIDAGWTDAPGLSETDWDGEARISNGTVDIGADEFVAWIATAPDPQPECEGPLFGQPQAGFPGWVWFSIPMTPSDTAHPNEILGFYCNGRLHRYDKYGKAPMVYRPPFSDWELAVGESYLLRLESAVVNPSYEGLSPFVPWEYRFKLGRQGWTWIGMPGPTDLGGEDFTSSVRAAYPSDETASYRTANEDHDATPDNWITWAWAYWNTWLQGAETFTPYAPFGHTTCHPWVGYRAWVRVGTAADEDDPDQVTLIWPNLMLANQ